MSSTCRTSPFIRNTVEGGSAGFSSKRPFEFGRSAGCRAAFLEVRESNTNARRLYVGMGFREVGQRRNYYNRPREHAIQYRKDALDNKSD